MHRPGREEENMIHFHSVIESAVHKSFHFSVAEFLMSVLVMCSEMSEEACLAREKCINYFY